MFSVEECCSIGVMKVSLPCLTRVYSSVGFGLWVRTDLSGQMAGREKRIAEPEGEVARSASPVHSSSSGEAKGLTVPVVTCNVSIGTQNGIQTHRERGLHVSMGVEMRASPVGWGLRSHAPPLCCELVRLSSGQERQARSRTYRSVQVGECQVPPMIRRKDVWTEDR
jgi:hypothetical protein